MEKNNKRVRRIVIVVGVITALVVAAVLLKSMLFPPYEGLPVSGKHAIGTVMYTWEDKSRIETYSDAGENRMLTVGFWYPEEEGKYPLVVFSHGAFGVIESNISTYKELASNGYVVASIGHPYHAMYVEDVNGKTTFVDMDFFKQVMTDNGGEYSEEAERRHYELSKEWMELRTADMNFVLDTILEKASVNENDGEKVFTLIDTTKIGLMGHSMGGAAAVQLGRERDDIMAVIDLEGTMLGEYVGFENGYEVYNEEAYPIPVLDVNSQAVREDIEALEVEHPGWKYVNDYLGENAADYREVVFNGAGHLNYTDLPLIAPPLAAMLGVGDVDATECLKNVNEVVLTYFDFYLKGEGSLDNIKPEY